LLRKWAVDDGAKAGVPYAESFRRMVLVRESGN